MKRTYKLLKKHLYKEQTDAIIDMFFTYFTEVKMPKTATKSWVNEHLYIFLYLISNIDKLKESDKNIHRVKHTHIHINHTYIMYALLLFFFVKLNIFWFSFTLITKNVIELNPNFITFLLIHM